tara:strand:- start:294 stop:452 length:159 start_codon:yes stop_codon:yes gene_type:complete
MIDRLLVGEFYHQTTKLTCLLFILILLSSCSNKERIPAPWTTIVKTVSGVVQ